MNKNKVKVNGKKIELYDIDEDIAELEYEEKRNKRLNIIITILIIFMLAVIGAAAYGVIYVKQAEKEKEIMLDPEIEIQEVLEGVTIDYVLKDGLVTYTVKSEETKAFTVCVYEVLSDGQLQCRYPVSILLNAENEYKSSKNFVAEKNTKYVIKVK